MAKVGRPGKYDHLKPAIKAEYETGHKKANHLSKEYGIPRNTISRWINEENWNISEQTNKAITTTIENMEHLAEQTEHVQEAFKKIVGEKTKHLDLINNVQALAVARIGQMLVRNVKKEVMIIRNGKEATTSIEEVELSPADLRQCVEATDKAAMTLGVVERHAKPAQVAVQQNSTTQYLSEGEVMKAVADALPD